MVDEDRTVAAAERAVLGAAMHNRSTLDRVLPILADATWSTIEHDLIWRAITRAARRDDVTVTDPVVVATQLQADGDQKAAGGHRALVDLYAMVVTPANAPFYANRVIEASIARRVVALGQRLAQTGSATTDLSDALAVAYGELDALTASRTDVGASSAGDVLVDTIDSLEAGSVGLPTGLRDLDELLGGLVPGQVITIGARPGGGKTLLGMQIALNAAQRGIPAFVLSLEMSRRELMLRLLSNVAKINSKRLHPTRPSLDSEDWNRIAEVSDELTALPLKWSDDTTVTPAGLSAMIGDLKRRHPDLGVVVIDYLQLMRGDRRTPNRQEEVSEISRAIKLMAKRHQVPIVLLSQLNQ